MSDITVITPSLPERHGFLADALESVGSQTLQPAAHLVGIDYARTGHGARIRNALAQLAQTTWLAFLDDDDWWEPNHLELLAGASEGADLVRAFFRMSDGSSPPEHHCDPADLSLVNHFHPSAALVRRSSFVNVGGFPDPQEPLWDDWLCWINLRDAGARFACVHEVTSVYRVHPDAIHLRGIPS